MPHTPVTSQPAAPVDAPKRDDWAWEKAAEIYAWAVLGSAWSPTTVMDMIAAELRTIRCKGSTETMKMVTDMQRDWGVS